MVVLCWGDVERWVDGEEWCQSDCMSELDMLQMRTSPVQYQWERGDMYIYNGHSVDIRVSNCAPEVCESGMGK